MAVVAGYSPLVLPCTRNMNLLRLVVYWGHPALFGMSAGGVSTTSKPTEGEVPPAGCAGVVCTNETNKKKTKWRAFFCCGSRGSGGGG